jgi:predicted mannosyl-3-phosphoglycerate phosphatase (HAD superfamily)
MQQYEHLIEALMELPIKIKDLQTSILNKNEESQKTSNEISKLEAKIKAEINAAVDTNGKKVFTNAEMREAELVERTSGDLEISALKEKHESISREIAEARLEVEMLSNQQRNTRSLLEFFAAFKDQI